jgi:hypothetical protein
MTPRACNERTPIWSSLQWKHTYDLIQARSWNLLQALWLLVMSAPAPSILSNSTVYYWKGRRKIPWETTLQPSTVSSSRPSQMLIYSFVITRNGETLWPTWQTLIPFQKYPWTPTQCQAFTYYPNALKGLLTLLPSISTWDSGQSLLTNLHNAWSSYLGESTVTSVFQWD